MLKKTDPQAIKPYLRDASNFAKGQASEVIVPENREELIGFLKKNSQPITPAGAGTGLTASRIPLSGIVISMERFKRLGQVDGGTLCVGSAVTLKEIQTHLQSSGWFYPPNPTEALASIGGTLATNASGARSYKFGTTRDFILEAEIVLADGRFTTVKRGRTVDQPLELEDGSTIQFPSVRFTSPSCKNAAGYYVQPGMDWLDLFIGSDGTLCLFTECRLKLLPSPADFLSGVLFFDNEEASWDLLEKLRDSKNVEISPCALEYFDERSLHRLKKEFSNIPDRAQAALYFEQEVNRREDYDPLLEAWFMFLEGEQTLLEDSWFAQSPKDIERFHEFRHQLPLLINEENSRMGRVKMGTDMAVSDASFLPMMRFYRDQLTASGMDFVMFGHIGDNHLHINLLPESHQMERARTTYGVLVDQILKWGGTISAEHGVGKLKKEYFKKMVGETALEELKMIKKTLDPEGLLGRGNLF
ncbi:MAG: FAD-binding protein [Nitrospinaceae bacterium]|nr:FAD-binding oxidoreductase [Nitrospinaceae bacterium]NIR55853.1 FAD-binding oxidoreductase [Nitrospinaceae bacterium]NIS86306.1 FAD-binding oxidoreductase [Nitrospinaceae bacterium]NIT83134.1 FAD-binding oxidoreductase [Nitrospinaceae bacterium]NIU45345.1 FAD-binding oxidoreductase [Nitrospinaceae bacterium]